MILVDRRVGSSEVAPIIRNLGIKVELATLDAADFAFEGNGPDGSVVVGIERKRIQDLLNCIDDGRYAGDQQHKMRENYQYCILITEGIYRPSPEGHLLERKGTGWVPPTGHPILYDKLFSFSVSVAIISGTYCIRSTSVFETAYQVVALYKWFQKHWEQHTSQFEVHRVVLPQFTKPSFERRVASQIGGIGVQRSIDVEKYFQTVPKMVNATEEQWVNIVGPKTALKIVREIRGRKD